MSNNLNEAFVNLERSNIGQSANNIFQSGSNVIRKLFDTNKFMAKVIFIIIVLIVFIIILRLATYILIWSFTPSKDPILIKGRINAKNMHVYTQNPKVKDSIPILRSNNEYNGMQFTWSVWIYIDDIHYKENKYKHVFHKGNDNVLMNTLNSDSNSFSNNAPGLYITDNQNELAVIMNTFNKMDEKILINNIPINKWVNVIIRVSDQKTIDVFINGVLSKRHICVSPIKQNYGDVFVAMDGGFSGQISELRYFSEAIGINSIKNLVYRGPNLAELSTSNIININPAYLSTRWYFNGNLDGYNP